MSPSEFEPDLIETARRIEAERPVPRAAFRGDLGRLLAAQAAKHRARPPRLRLLVNSLAGSGAALIAFAAVGVAGVGPFGA